jgi:pimeloyl-ACP methyl ester carboxylesterase
MTSTATAPRPAGYTEPTYVDVQGRRTAYRRAGAGAPVVYLHGHWATRRWLPFHEALSHGVDLIAPEHPGFGESAAFARPAGRDDLTLHHRDLIDTVVDAPVHLVGYGLGAWLAADVAVWFPERVASLSVIAPFGLRVPGAPIADIFLMNPAEMTATYYHHPEGHAGLVPGVGTPDQGGVEEFAHRYGELGAAASLIWERRYDLKLESRLPRVDRPALVVSAAHDRVVPDAHGARWAELLSARRTTIADAGHAVVVEQPEAVAAAITGFVTEVSER